MLQKQLHSELIFLCHVKKVKVSHSLIAIGESGAIPLLMPPYPSVIQKRYPFTAGLTERVFQSSHGEASLEPMTLRRLSAS